MIENALDFEGLQSHTEKMKSYIKDEIQKESARAIEVENNKVDNTTVATESSLGLVKSGTDITVDDSGNVSVKDNSHNHTLSNISDVLAMPEELNILCGADIKSSELNSLKNVTSNIQEQLNNKASSESPLFTGEPEAPTADLGTNTKQIATTEFVQNEIANLTGDSSSNAKVTQTLTNNNENYPLLLAPSGQTTTTTITSYFDSGVTLNASTNTITANISGNAGTATKWATARNINGLSVDGSVNRVNYGICSTAAATVAKTVTCIGFSLVTGAEITVKFMTTNVATSPTLNVNGTGAKAIYYKGTAIESSYLAANSTYTFRYNGTQYELVGDINATYTLNYDAGNSELQLKRGDNVVSAITVVGDSSDDFLKIVTWADGTYKEISTMLDAHYAGIINISDYWSVGDVRTIPISPISATGVGETQSAQNAEVVIIGFGHDDLVNPINDNTKSAVSLQLKNCLGTNGYMYPANYGTSNSLWDGSPRRTWCNGVFKNALPSELVNLIKTVTKKTWRYAHSSYSSYRTQQTTNDDCFLISEFEVFGVQGLSTTDYGAVGEDGTQYEYYKTSSNRIKYLGVNGTSANMWYLRSSYVNINGNSNFHLVGTSGSVGYSSANYTCGVAPGFCI